MNAKLEKIDKGFAMTARLVVGILMVFFTGVLALSSLLHTTGMEIVKEGDGISNVVNTVIENIESVVYYNDNIFANLIWLALCMVACILVMPLLEKLSLRSELLIVGAWVVLLGILWVSSSQTAPSEDSVVVTNASVDFAKEKYKALTDYKDYFTHYSFQLGYVFFNELLIRFWSIFGEVKSVFFLEFFNVFFLAATYIGVILINDRLFEDKRVRHLTAFMLMFCLQPVIFCVFLYGIIPGFAFAVWAVYFELIFLKSDSLKSRIIFGLLAGLMITLAVLVKTNNYIVLVAMVIMAGVTLFRENRAVFNILFSVIWITASLVCQSSVISMYESRADVDLGKPVPFVSWIAMGFNEAVNAPGWYNYTYTGENYEKANKDVSKASKKSQKEISKRLKYFNENKQYRNDFFYKKFVSQWNETSYQSIWNNKVRYQYEDKFGWAEFACGDGEAATKRYMDIYSMFVFFAAVVGVVYVMKKKNTLAMILPLIVLGGMLYHLLAEAKSQYALPYFILIVGISAAGIVMLNDALKPFLENKLGEFKRKRARKRLSAENK